jgi:hypothetical protein
MRNRKLRWCHAAVSAALAMNVGSNAGAKPPDLPSASREVVAPQAQQPAVGERQRQDKPRTAEPLTVMPTPVEQLSGMPSRIKKVPAPGEQDPERSGARRLYLIGERCRRSGDLDMAANCYHETELLSPRSAYGRRAHRRLQEIETLRRTTPPVGDAEEQEPPRPMPKRPPSAADREPVLYIAPPPRNLTIHVDEPESW